ncbi:hypothetical protein CLV51_10458 [Chitinophaga niastensis]|uniref:Uncharacterized protein n=1 Tax=Chitinophaga niastensis TaxID=536980 RepID=A0A2P8HGL8_CHINA|nr:contractile injection system tape measure protein [Chitinophaga niastensis]PSL45356.1 hypothetical protein CLV51_10458 [Chitinophaga niastensis]
MKAHIIQRYSFDVRFDSRSRAFALQDKLSTLFRQTISPGTDDLLQQLIPDDMMAAIDTLELDIGEIAYKDLEAEMPPRILAALQQVLTDLLYHNNAGAQDNITGEITIRKGEDRLFELMSYFLLHGIMPWWATTGERMQPGEVILQLSGTSPNRLAAFLRSIAKSAYVRERMVHQFSTNVLHAIVQVLEPAEALFIIAYSRDILQLQQKQQLLHTETNELEKAIWLFMLTYLIMERGTNFNRKEFVRSNLTQLAHHFNLSYETMLELFYEAQALYKANIPEASLGGFIRNLFAELTGKDKRKSFIKNDPSHKKIMEDTGEQINILRYYLLYGAIPWWAPAITTASLQEMLVNTGYRAANPLKQMLQTVLQHKAAAGRWTNFMASTATVIKKEVYLREIKTWADATIADAPYTENSAVKQVLLRDVILHLLTYGSISWWGKAYAHFSLNSLLEQLADQHPDQTLTILEYAGTMPDAMQRLIAGIKAPVFFRLLKHSGMDTAAEEVYDNIYVLLMAVQQLTTVTTLPLEQFVLQALWQSLAITRYRRVDKPVLLQHLMMPSWSASPVVAPQMMHFLLQQLLPAINHLSGNTVLSTDLQEWVKVLPLQHKKMLLPVEILQPPAVVAAWLQQFLVSGQLPAAAGTTDAPYAARLLQWLYTYHSGYMQSLQNSITLSPLLFQQLQEILLLLEPDTAPVQALLQPWLDKAMATDPQLATTINSRLYQPSVAFRSLLQRMQRYAAVTEEDKRKALLEEARQLLTMFLTRHRLPDKLGSLSLSTTNEIMKAVVILLFEETPAILHQLFINHRQQLAARLQLYGLFSFHAGIPESHIRQSLDAYAVQDSLLLLQETAGDTLHSSMAGLRDAVRFYKQRSQTERKLFYSKILQHPALVQQMAQHLDDDAFLDMMQDTHLGWTGNTVDALRELQQLLETLLPGSHEKEQLQLAFRRFHLLLLGGHIHVYDTRSYATRFLAFITATAPVIANPLINQLAQSIHHITALSYTHIRNILPVLQQQATAHITASQHQQLLRESLYEKDRQLTGTPPSSGPSAEKELPPPRNKDADTWAKVKKLPLETIYTGNAGLIILHPFLPYGFKRLGLVNDEGFVNREAQHRGVHLLQYMVNGKEVHAEHELALNKILCNLPLEEPVPAEMLLTGEEKQLCGELLQVLLQRWEKMNNTSVEGFQAAFLQREGALWQKEDDWWLRVEQRGYDMILQTLPWGIGMIKTPWMEKTIYTEWAYS